MVTAANNGNNSNSSSGGDDDNGGGGDSDGSKNITINSQLKAAAVEAATMAVAEAAEDTDDE
jgi:hypothetical protein